MDKKQEEPFTENQGSLLEKKVNYISFPSR